MLVLTRKVNESIVIDGEIVITVLEVGRGGQVRLGISAPPRYQVHRQEVLSAIQAENRRAAAAMADEAMALAHRLLDAPPPPSVVQPRQE